MFHRQSKLIFCDFWPDGADVLLTHKSYYIGVEFYSGFLNKDGMVIDFGICKREIRKIIEAFEGKVLLASLSRRFEYIDEGPSIKVMIDHDAFYSFPKENCLFLVADDTSPDSIGKVFATEIQKSLNLQNGLGENLTFKITIINPYGAE